MARFTFEVLAAELLDSRHEPHGRDGDPPGE